VTPAEAAREVTGCRPEAAPPADGWRDREPPHRLFPVLVRAVLFGRGYA
jgi:fructosamine-3-kinase